MRIISWNINGIKSHYEALKELVAKYDPDIICLQKVKATHGTEGFPLPGYEPFDLRMYRSQYYGCASYLRGFHHPLMNFPNKLGAEGHFQAMALNIRDCLFNVYAPFSNDKIPQFIEERKEWNQLLNVFISTMRGRSIIMCGDFNVVHLPDDTCKSNYRQNKPCYFDWEREDFNKFLDSCNLVDVFRHLHPQDRKYTYFDSKADYRATNEGDRIDYFLISTDLLPKVKDCDIIEDFRASNSNPLILDIDLGVAPSAPGCR